MPWNKNTLDAVKAGLRDSAVNGQFVPHRWIEGIQSQNNGHVVHGCGWGIVGWYVAVMIGGADWAQRMLPVGATQADVDEVLQIAGLTPAEIESMDPMATWEAFDNALHFTHHYREQNWVAYINKSLQLAEFFIMILEEVDIVEHDELHLPYAVMAPKNPEKLVLQNPFFAEAV